MAIATDDREFEPDLAEPFFRLRKDLKKAAVDLSRRDARWLVDMYYDIQENRIRSAHQQSKMAEQGEPHALIEWCFDSMRHFEAAIKSALGEFAGTYAVGQWLQAQYGIGPVLSAALLSYFDIRRAPTVGHFWRFAGLDPTRKWEKGQKRPYCARLKSICAYKMGESFVKFQNRQDCIYGHLFAAKKAEYADRNARGQYADFARAEMESKRSKSMEKTERWKHWQEGHIAPANVHDRARRWTVKLFLSHLHHVMHVDYFQKPPPAPYVFDHPELGDHRHLIAPPLWPAEYQGRKLAELLD